MKVWIARVDTRYEVVAVGESERDAIRIACEKALAFLSQNNAVVPGETDTVDGIEEYFGVWAQEIEVGSAALWGMP